MVALTQLLLIGQSFAGTTPVRLVEAWLLQQPHGGHLPSQDELWALEGHQLAQHWVRTRAAGMGLICHAVNYRV